MPRPVYIPDAPEITVVETADELFAHKRADHESMILLPRPISGCFNDLAIWLLRRHPACDAMTSDGSQYLPVCYRVGDLEGLKEENGMDWPDELALICGDMHRMEQAKRVTAELRVIREKAYHPSTYEFHQDGAGQVTTPLTEEVGRLMCCYNDPVTECLLIADAHPVYLTGLGFSGIFLAKDDAKPYRPGVGDMWRQVCMGQGGYPLVHRAVPIEPAGRRFPWIGPRSWNPPRLLTVC